jgi:hypothetical protein
VAFKPQGATNTSYFDLEEGHLEPHWDLYEDTAGGLRALLRLATRPYAHTGTTRLVASVLASGPTEVSIPSAILGDAPAYLNLGVSASPPGGAYPGIQPIIYGVARSASYRGIRRAASLSASVSNAGAAIVGASGAIASQYLGISPNGASNAAAYLGVGFAMCDVAEPIGAADAHLGRNRIFIGIRHRFSPATALSVRLLDKNHQVSFAYRTVGATAMVPAEGASAWQLVDLGEAQVPLVGSVAATQTYHVMFSLATGASVVASPAIQLAGMFFVPLGDSAGVFAGSTWAITKSSIDMRSYPRAEVVASDLGPLRDVSAVYQGDAPHIPPGASGPQKVVVIYGGYAKSMEWMAPVTISAHARERWTYLR